MTKARAFFLGIAFLVLQDPLSAQTPFLQFPIAGVSAYGNGLISSVFDHHVGHCYAAENQNPTLYPYPPDDVVTAYNGEEGRKSYGEDPGNTTGYKNRAGEEFSLGGNNHYSGKADEVYLYYEGHPAIDLAVGTDKQVVAAAGGTVIAAVEGHEDLGNYIEIDHLNGYFTLYAHLSTIDDAVIKDPQVISGQKIGHPGSSGTKSVHLHFEVRRSRSGPAVDPYGWRGKDVLWKDGCPTGKGRIDDKGNLDGPQRFDDVSAEDWYESYVELAVENDFMKGFADCKFRGNQKATRIEVLEIAYEVTGEVVGELPTDFDDGFVDIEPCDSFYATIADAKMKGFINGRDCKGEAGTCFDPFAPVNRAEALKILSEVYGIDSGNFANFINVPDSDALSFPDVSDQDWFYPYVHWMANAQIKTGPFPQGIERGQRIVGGYPGGNFEPASPVNRAELAKISIGLQQYFSSGSSPSPAPRQAVVQRVLPKAAAPPPGSAGITSRSSTARTPTLRHPSRSPVATSRSSPLRSSCPGTASMPTGTSSPTSGPRTAARSRPATPTASRG